MRTIVGRDRLEPPGDGSAVTIGTFDGVHVGHRALISSAVDGARLRGTTSAAITWDRHPAVTLRPEAVPQLLCTPERKLELIASCGVELLAVLAFDRELARLPPEDFARDVLARDLRARSVYVGAGWRFGHRAAGDVALLQRLGAELGFEVVTAGLVEIEGGPASSSRARAAVAAGDLRLAAALLGRPFEVEGTVLRGEGRGRALGYPTANVAPVSGLVRPPLGVYAGEALVDGTRFKAAINLGVNPTFDDVIEPRYEAHLLDFSADLYDRVLRLELHRRLRDERRYDSVPELLAQMVRDIEATRALTC